MISVSLPARINVLGSPTDGVEGAYATISTAVELRGGATLIAADGLRVRRADGRATTFAHVPIADGTGFEVEAAAVNAFCRFAPHLANDIGTRGVSIQTWTDIPASSGLGGSSVLVLAVLAGLRAFYRLDAARFNDYVLAEIAQRAEEQDMGVACGYADRYAPLFGDLAYISYHGKLWHAPLGEEPYATYEPLGARVPRLQFCVATTGVQRDSGAVHAPMRAQYLAERQRGGGPLLALARRLGETAWRGKIALLAGDLISFGKQINRNQELIDEMMTRCGFSTGAGTEVRLLIDAALQAGALGAKLTGAGGGGAVFAVPPPGAADAIATALTSAAATSGLSGSEVFVLGVSATGLRMEGVEPSTSDCA